MDYLLDRTEYKSPIESIDRGLIGQYNTVFELSPKQRQELIDYIGMLKQSDELESQQKN